VGLSLDLHPKPRFESESDKEAEFKCPILSLPPSAFLTLTTSTRHDVLLSQVIFIQNNSSLLSDQSVMQGKEHLFAVSPVSLHVCAIPMGASADAGTQSQR